jgi:hemin uptake protein HemP
MQSTPAEPRPTAARRWRSADIFGAAQEIEIEHGQAVYRLRLTSLGKLILTK